MVTDAQVFISFPGQDRKVASTLCAALESRGFSCWISSRDIQPGENFQVAIVRAIRKAKVMLLVFTANSNRSEEMNKELALASQQKLPVIPLRVEDVTPNDAFAYEFATRQWIDFFADWESAVAQLAGQIAKIVPQTPAGHEPAPAAPRPAVHAAASVPAPAKRRGPLVLAASCVVLAIVAGAALFAVTSRKGASAEDKSPTAALSTAAPAAVPSAPAPAPLAPAVQAAATPAATTTAAPAIDAAAATAAAPTVKKHAAPKAHAPLRAARSALPY